METVENSRLGKVAFIEDHAGLKCFKVAFTGAAQESSAQ